MSEQGHNSIAAERLNSIISRFERLDEEIKALKDDQKDIMTEAKSAGFDVKVIKAILARRKKDSAELDELRNLASEGKNWIARYQAQARALQPRHWALPLLLGALIGVLVTLTSVGAGAIGVTALMLLYPLLPLPRIVAADIAYAVPLTLVAGLGHASLGSVDWPLLAKLLAGSLPGIWLGTRLTHHTLDRVIRSLLSVLLAWAGTKLVLI